MNAVEVTETHIGPYEIHPLVRGLPNMPDDQWPAFRDSIGKYGLQHKIVRVEGKIFDGRQRIRGCLETNTPPQFEDLQPRGRTPEERDLWLRLKVKFFEFDRKHLSPRERAAAIVMMFPAKPRGRPKSSENADQENVPHGTISAPNDSDLASAAGTSLRTLKRARADEAERDEDEQRVKDGCIPSVRKAVGKEFTARAAANLAGLPDDEQKKILKVFRDEKCSLVAALRKVRARNEEMPGASVKTKVGWVKIIMAIPGETDALRADSAEEWAREQLQKRHVDPDRYPPRVISVGLNPGELRECVRCARRECRCLLFDDSPTRKTERGMQCKECPDGRG